MVSDDQQSLLSHSLPKLTRYVNAEETKNMVYGRRKIFSTIRASCDMHTTSLTSADKECKMTIIGMTSTEVQIGRLMESACL